MDDTGEHIGYTRYGDWSGDPFGEWNLSFAAFCLRFGGAAEEAFPAETTAESWRTALDARDLYQPLEGAEPANSSSWTATATARPTGWASSPAGRKPNPRTAPLPPSRSSVLP